MLQQKSINKGKKIENMIREKKINEELFARIIHIDDTFTQLNNTTRDMNPR